MFVCVYFFCRRWSQFGVTPKLSSRGLSCFAYLNALYRFSVNWLGVVGKFCGDALRDGWDELSRNLGPRPTNQPTNKKVLCKSISHKRLKWCMGIRHLEASLFFLLITVSRRKRFSCVYFQSLLRAMITIICLRQLIYDCLFLYIKCLQCMCLVIGIILRKECKCSTRASPSTTSEMQSLRAGQTGTAVIIAHCRK